MRYGFLAGVGGLAFAILAASTLEAATPAGLIGNPSQWREIEVPNRKATQFRFDQSGAIRIDSHMSVSFLMRKVAANGTRREPTHVSWRWRVDGKVVPTDLARKGGDDRPVALHLFFGKPEAQRSLFSRLFDSFPPAGHALTYVWGGTRPEESIIVNPYFKNGRILIVRNASTPARTWRTEQRDLAADLQRAFGDTRNMGRLIYVAVSGDTDDTHSRTSARIAQLSLGGDKP